MAGKLKREELERSFVNAGLYRLCKREPGDSMSDDQRMVFGALVAASQRIQYRELKILASAFYGITASGETLSQE